MAKPMTKAGQWLESEEPYLSTWAWGPMGEPVILAIEAEARAIEHDVLKNEIARLEGLVMVYEPIYEVVKRFGEGKSHTLNQRQMLMEDAMDYARQEAEDDT